MSTTLDSVEDGVSTVGNVASEVVDIKDLYTELEEAKDDWQTEVNDTIESLKVERETSKIESTVTANIDSIDFTRNEPTN